MHSLAEVMIVSLIKCSRRQRFVLAEMIKASTLDITALAHFILSKNIEPNWMQMQLPPGTYGLLQSKSCRLMLLGRNMIQCVKAAEDMAIMSPFMKRNLSNGPTRHGTKRNAPVDDAEEYSAVSVLPMPTTSHVPIAPRPTNRCPEVPQPYERPPRKKRGRPSRADKAKMDLRPNLPPHLAPRPPLVQLSTIGPQPPALIDTSRFSLRAPTPPAGYSTAPGVKNNSKGQERSLPVSDNQALPASSISNINPVLSDASI